MRTKYRYYIAWYTDELLPNGDFELSATLGRELTLEEVRGLCADWQLVRAKRQAKKNGKQYFPAGLGGLWVVANV